MFRLLSAVLSLVLTISLVAPGFAKASTNINNEKESVNSDNLVVTFPTTENDTVAQWLDKEEELNSISEEEMPELFVTLEEVNWDEVELDDIQDGEVDWSNVPIEVDEEIVDREIQPFIWGFVARVLISGGKHVIKWGSKVFKKAPKSKVTNALANYTTGTYKAGSHTFKLTKSDMQHMLTRHHPRYWDGSVKSKQTFYNPNLSINEIKNIAIDIAKQNRTTLSKKGTNATFQVEGKVDGVKYVLGITKGHIKQLYPK